MDRREFCDMLIAARVGCNVSKESMQRLLGITFGQIQLLETRPNNFKITKAIGYLNVLKKQIHVKWNGRDFMISNFDCIAEFLKEIITKRNTIREMARISGCTEQTIRLAVSGNVVMSVDTFLKITNAYGCGVVINGVRNVLVAEMLEFKKKPIKAFCLGVQDSYTRNTFSDRYENVSGMAQREPLIINVEPLNRNGFCTTLFSARDNAGVGKIFMAKSIGFAQLNQLANIEKGKGNFLVSIAISYLRVLGGSLILTKDSEELIISSDDDIVSWIGSVTSGGTTAYAIAKKIGCLPSSVRNVIRGKNAPHIDMFLSIASAFGFSVLFRFGDQTP